MKKRLTVALVTTIVVYLLSFLCDMAEGVTILQAFLDLIFQISFILTLWFWFLLRQEKKKKAVPSNSSRNKSLVDIVIVFVLMCAIGASCSYVINLVYVIAQM